MDFQYPLRKSPIAIVGMACIFPKARNLQEYWTNIVKKEYCITDIPASRWSADDYYDPDPQAADKTYCKKGGFISDIDFDPLEFGLPPNSLEAIDPSQLIALIAAKTVLEDMGYSLNKPERDRVGVVLGASTSMQLATTLKCRLQYPLLKKVLQNSGVSESDSEKICKKMQLGYVDWQEGSFPGLLANVIAGRIANRLDLGGTSCTVDAACASSLAAVKIAISELLEHRCDVMITGGVDTQNDAFTYLCFSKTPALSKAQVIRPFDTDADGTIISEGVGMIALKRLEDAERDNDRIYAVIRGIGSSSDGKSKSIYAPSSEGQKKALHRAYREADFDASSVGLIEAHGTGTSAGDIAEFTALREYFEDGSPQKQSIALGSVKSQIGHTKAAAGIASLIKAALSIHHKILPPTININKPNPKLGMENSPFYLNRDARPWIRAGNMPKRRAGVSAFGFGGANFHIVLEEHKSEADTGYRLHKTAETFFLFDENTEKLSGKCGETLKRLEADDGEEYFNYLIEKSNVEAIPSKSARVGFTADSFDNAKELLCRAAEMLAEKHSEDEWEDSKGIYYRKSGIDSTQKVVALFSGQGSQYPNMGKELVNNFPCVREIFGHFDSLLTGDGLQPLSGIVYPVSDSDRDNNAGLQRTEYAQPAIGALSLGLYKILKDSGFQPDFLAGHSFGEITALRASGILEDESFCELVKARGQAMAVPDLPGFDGGKMLAVKGELGIVQEVLKNFPGVIIANWNSGEQVVLAGPTRDIEQVHALLKEKELNAVMLSVAAAFHTPLMNYAAKPFEEVIDKIDFKAAEIPVFSNTTAKMYPKLPEAIRKQIKKHMLSPVLFKEEIENVYKEGGFVFVEFGPKNVLTNLTKHILKGKPHITVALNADSRKDSDRQLREAVVKLKVTGVKLGDIDPYKAKRIREVQPPKNKLTFRINGSTYVSEKTKKTFEEELNNGTRISTLNVHPLPGQEKNTVSLEEHGEPGRGPSSFDSGIGSFISEIKAQQNTSLEIHKMFLHNQAEYENNFFRSMEKLSSCPQDDLHRAWLDSLDNNLSRYHDFQMEVLKAHGDYLEHITRQDDKLLDVLEALLKTGPVNPAGTQTAQIPARSLVNRTAPSKSSLQAPPKIEETVISMADNIKPEAVPQTGPEKISAALLSVVSEKTGYPVETLELDMDMESDLGIDSIKRVEILGAMRGAFPDLPGADTEAMSEMRTLKAIADYLRKTLEESGSTPYESKPVTQDVKQSPVLKADMEKVTSALLSVVSEKTGYPVETLELDMDMESDLGIDSIKRVEILGAMRGVFPDLPGADTEAMSEMRTLKAIADYLSKTLEESGCMKKKSLT